MPIKILKIREVKELEEDQERWFLVEEDLKGWFEGVKEEIFRRREQLGTDRGREKLV